VADPVVDAAASNASWCDTICRTLGISTRWTAEAWTVAERSPEGYPDAVTLSRDAEAAALLMRVDDQPGCSVKDSFAVLDLEPWGFHVLFEATWIQRTSVGGAGAVTTLDWHAARTAAELEQWSEGHGLDVFIPTLLDREHLRFYGTGSGNGAGFALHRGGGVVGVSNMYAGSADLGTVWSDLVVVAARAYPGFKLMGYELGADLQAALAAGFAAIGPLRVWML
jgi:hypothetical protein